MTGGLKIDAAATLERAIARTLADHFGGSAGYPQIEFDPARAVDALLSVAAAVLIDVDEAGTKAGRAAIAERAADILVHPIDLLQRPGADIIPIRKELA